ncbi:MAG TPA: hypothetical protein VHW23_08445 [Kofleriaceae bacterium]|nr:hypothetical protein [Kofleriaceae bacterium]
MFALVAAIAACSCSYMRHPTDTTTWGKPEGAMVLGIEARGDVINTFLQNRAARPQRIIARGITVKLARLAADGTPGEVTSVADRSDAIHLDRDDSFETLAPAEVFATPIPVPKLAPGTYQVTASYTALTAKAGDWWGGIATAGPINYVVQ